MFTLAQVKEAHSRVKSGADFPAYVQELIRLGVTKYEHFVGDGHIEYFGENNFQIESSAKYDAIPVAETADIERFKHFLKIHQNGETDYLNFCRHSAETGVEKWTVDTTEMSCIYYDLRDDKMLAEQIPD